MDKNFTIDTIKEKILNIGPKIVISIIIFILFYVIAMFISNSIKSYLLSKIYSENSIKLKIFNINDIIYYIILFLGLFIALNNLGIDNSTIIAVIGSLGIALGLAIQSSLSNIASGLYISVSELFNINDIIEINYTNNIKNVIGRVISFNLTNTYLLDNDNNTIIIPNNIIQTNAIKVYKNIL